MRFLPILVDVVAEPRESLGQHSTPHVTPAKLYHTRHKLQPPPRANHPPRLPHELALPRCHQESPQWRAPRHLRL